MTLSLRHHMMLAKMMEASNRLSYSKVLQVTYIWVTVFYIDLAWIFVTHRKSMIMAAIKRKSHTDLLIAVKQWYWNDDDAAREMYWQPRDFMHSQLRSPLKIGAFQFANDFHMLIQIIKILTYIQQIFKY